GWFGKRPGQHRIAGNHLGDGPHAVAAVAEGPREPGAVERLYGGELDHRGRLRGSSPWVADRHPAANLPAVPPGDARPNPGRSATHAWGENQRAPHQSR